MTKTMTGPGAPGTTGPNLAALQRALTLIPRFADLPAGALTLMPVKGLAHDHVEIAGTGLLLRVPRQSQYGFTAAENLTYQATCFERISASGHAPRLEALIPPEPALPMGALLVERIEGRAPRLPAELPALAEALAAIHALPLPAPEARPPLAEHADPVAGTLREIESQTPFLPRATLSEAARAEIEAELAWARGFDPASLGGEQPLVLALMDTHPGNFLIQANGRAIIVDLEKALYGSAGIDLAHATVYSSTTWDLDTYAELSVQEVAGFYRTYLAALPSAQAAALRPWLVPLRRLLFLRAITWCAKWSVAQKEARRADKLTAGSTEDWSAENSDPDLIAHVAGRVAHYLEAETLRRMRAEWLAEPGLESLIG